MEWAVSVSENNRRRIGIKIKLKENGDTEEQMVDNIRQKITKIKWKTYIIIE